MELKDYLHYYLGATFWTNNSEGEVNPETLRFIYPMIEKNKDVRLVLHRLEDMTREEARDFLKHAVPGAEYITHNEHAVIWKSQGSRAEIFFLFGPPAGFHYLLRKHFDLFGLIDAGLAIDAKTVEQ